MIRGRWGAAVLLAALPVTAGAAPSGALIAAVCANCHAAGDAGSIPSFADMTGNEVAAALRRFRDGVPEATIMPRLARGLTEAEIAALAAHLDLLAAGGAP